MEREIFLVMGDAKTLEGLAALQRERLAVLQAAGVATDAYRLVDGAGDGFEGVYLDVFGDHWLVNSLRDECPRSWVDAVKVGLCQSIWWKRLDSGEKRSPECLAGDAAASFGVNEGGVSFEIQPAAGYNCGLFLDQRLSRQRAKDLTHPGTKVLNLFSYTCSFSVVTAAAGAMTTSVDLNAGYLEWAKRNFELNGISASGHHWIKGDSFDWLRVFAKKERLFDGVVLDPPTFSRGTTKKVFRAEADYAELVSLAAKVVAPGGWLYCSTNTYRQSPELFEAQVDIGLRDIGRRFGKRRWMPMPPDFTGPSYLKSLWLEDAMV